ncbi:hypothetical protein [Legionella impletisoli]|uniref:Coiled-coil protein n=1 Tax=Legionella impletisoli TaxID=343510 RepID=A0A917JSB8_9GAMM|nr:hypothetical protein [Legionella impletisoli]GGI84342.1 hypothetical protein GCM10007966_11280 [Legionella impletisoli]
MHTTLSLSPKSQALLSQMTGLIQDETLLRWQKNPEAVERRELITWLNQTIPSDKSTRFLIESFFTSLLQDLRQSFSHEPLTPQPKQPWYRKATFFGLAIAGTLLAICEGFDGVASLFGLLPAISPLFLIGAGVVFSILSVAVFYGFDLAGISDNLGVKFKQTPKLLDVLLEQTAEIKKLRKYIDSHFHKAKTAEELDEMRMMIRMLRGRYEALQGAREEYQRSLNNPVINTTKSVVGVLTGVLFFSGGFFTGQSLGIAIAGLMGVSAAVTFPPILILSVLAGLAAFSLYWYLEKPGVENLVSDWFGLNKEKIEQFSDENEVAKQLQKLDVLEEKLPKLPKVQPFDAPDRLARSEKKGLAESEQKEGLYHSNGLFRPRLTRSRSENNLGYLHSQMLTIDRT